MEITYELTIEYDDDYDGPMPTETDIEVAMRLCLPDSLGGDVTSIFADKI